MLFPDLLQYLLLPRVAREQLEHIVEEASKLAVADTAEECRVGSNAEERITVRLLDDCDAGSSEAV